MHHRPHHIEPDAAKVRVLFLYKNFAAKAGISHIGLGVSLHNTCLSLRHAGIWADVEPIASPRDAQAVLERKAAEAQAKGHPPYSHAVFSAPWVPVAEFKELCRRWPEIAFLSLCHSNVGFLQFDTRGVTNIRHYLDLEQGTHNFFLAGNNERFTGWVEAAYGRPCIYLPNLYFLGERRPPRRGWDGSILRIGCFGAIRPQKNLMSSVGAALEIHQLMRADTEVYISSGRPENASVITNSVREMLEGLPGIRLIDNGWQSWPAFRRTIAQMDLLLQPSYSETFNIVTADGIAEGVPSVVTNAIEWAPMSWRADADDAGDIARKGCHLLQSHHAAHDGWEALARYIRQGLAQWQGFLLRHRRSA